MLTSCQYRIDSVSDDVLIFTLEFTNWRRLPPAVEKMLSARASNSSWALQQHIGKKVQFSKVFQCFFFSSFSSYVLIVSDKSCWRTCIKLGIICVFFMWGKSGTVGKITVISFNKNHIWFCTFKGYLKKSKYLLIF